MADVVRSRIWDNTLDIEARLDALLSELTLEEKTLLCGTGAPAIERLDIPAYSTGGEAAHGVEARHDQVFNLGETVKTTSFPQPFGMSMMWDPELMERIGEIVGTEARIHDKLERAKGKPMAGLCRWAPTVDMERDPRWGRTEEGYGEDPYLTGKTASAYIRGMRGKDERYIRCGASLKHFYANNMEKERVSASSSISLRDKFEYYIEPFRRCIEEGGAEAIMTAYNELNGVPAICDPDVQKLLKDTYHLPGHVVCDGGDMVQTVQFHHYFDTHAQTVAAALKAGVDAFTDSSEIVVPAVREALEKGLLTETDLDRAIRNSFRTRIRLGQFDPVEGNPYADPDESMLCCEAHAKVAALAADEAVTLLKNENGFLPFASNRNETIAVVGPMADVWYKDWYCGIPPYEVTVLDGIRKACIGSEIRYADGLDRIKILVDGKYVAVDFGSDEVYLTDESQAAVFIKEDWGDGGVTFREVTSGRFLVAVDEKEQICLGTTEAFKWFIKEAFHLKFVPGEQVGLVTSWCGQPLFVRDGKLCAHMRPEDMAVTGGQEDTLSGVTRSNEIVSPARIGFELVEDGAQTAVSIVKNADRVILCLGANPVINAKEEIDRNHLHLPKMQEQLLTKVSEVNGNVVLVLISNYPYVLPEEADRLPAIVFSASGCQEYGNAVARVLTGMVNPAGHLSMEWIADEKELADIADYDLLEGKRTYRYWEKDVIYPFGYGLSYSSFSYDSIELMTAKEEAAVGNMDGELVFRVSVTNTSDVDGEEVIQLYYHKADSAVKRPNKQLVGFKRIKIPAGKTVCAEFVVPKQDLVYYDVIEERLLLERGTYHFMAGGNSRELPLELEVMMQGDYRKNRAMEKWYPADHFDEQHGTYLYKGYEEETSVFARQADKGGRMIYDNCRYRGEKADAYEVEIRRVTKDVRNGERVYAKYREERIPLKNEEVLAAIAADCEFSLVLDVEGCEGVTAFRIVPCR